jgi:predicted phosphodiesterase
MWEHRDVNLEQIAVVSDVHGNLSALDAVLADIRARGITRVINLGDDAGKGPRGSAVVDRLAEVCEADVRGNWDDFLATIPDDGPTGLVWWRDELRPAQLAGLRQKPRSHDLQLSGRRIRLFHASARSVHVRVHFHHTQEEFDGMFAATDLTGPGPAPDMVGYGDVHDTYVETHRGRTLFNVGSVGNPLDEPTPSYAILEGVPDAAEPAPFSLRLVRVPYDVEAELAVARDLGMPQYEAWAGELRTGIYRHGADAVGAPR